MREGKNVLALDLILHATTTDVQLLQEPIVDRQFSFGYRKMLFVIFIACVWALNYRPWRPSWPYDPGHRNGQRSLPQKPLELLCFQPVILILKFKSTVCFNGIIICSWIFDGIKVFYINKVSNLLLAIPRTSSIDSNCELMFGTELVSLWTIRLYAS